MNNDMEEATNAFIDVILKSEVYKNYKNALETVKQDPGLKEQIDMFRSRNFQLQTSRELDFDKLDQLERDYHLVRDNPVAAEFLQAEVDLCRMMQRLNRKITEELHFE